MTLLSRLAGEFAITVTNGEVWLSIGEALVLAAGSLLFGVWVARRVRLLRRNAPLGETAGVGLAVGLIILTSWWAALWSGGRSSFTPVAVGFAISIALTLRPRGALKGTDRAAAVPDPERSSFLGHRAPRGQRLVATMAATAFIVGVALLYGSTMAPSPRDGVQPVEFMDEALYAVLGRDLAVDRNGSELATVRLPVAGRRAGPDVVPLG